MESSILKSTKKVLSVAPDDDAFDLDIITHINSVFSDLNDLGVGPELGFMIEDDTATWVDFLGDDKRLNRVRTYVFLRVRVLFDPPTSGYHLTALKEQIKEQEWRINVARENTLLQNSTQEPIPDSPTTQPADIVDGGASIGGGTSDPTILDGGTP